MKEKKKMSLLLKLVIAIVLGIVVGFVTPGMGAFGEVIIRIGATYNSIFGNFLNFVIPLIIIGFVAPGIADLGAGAGKTRYHRCGLRFHHHLRYSGLRCGFPAVSPHGPRWHVHGERRQR